MNCIVCGKEITQSYANSRCLGNYCRSCANNAGLTTEQINEFKDKQLAELKAENQQLKQNRIKKQMKMSKVYIVKAPQGEYESYQEPIVKVFLDKKKAQQYVKEENAKLPLEQATKCQECYFMWENPAQKGKIRPSCFNGDKYNNCQDYFKYHDIQKLFIEEYEVEE